MEGTIHSHVSAGHLSGFPCLARIVLVLAMKSLGARFSRDDLDSSKRLVGASHVWDAVVSKIRSLPSEGFRLVTVQ